MKKIVLFVTALFLVLTFSGCNPNDGTSGLGNTNDDIFVQGFGGKVDRDFIGQVVDTNNQPIQNADITIGDATVQTDVNGVFIIKNAEVRERFAYITAKKTGYIDGSRSLVPTTGKNNVKIMLLPNTPVQTIPSDTASEVALPNGTKVAFDGAFQDETGNAYTGDVTVAMFHLTPSNANISQLMPGMLCGQTLENKQAVMQTFGMLNVELRGTSGQKLNLAEGHTAEITMDIDASQLATAPTTIPLWHFDETLGYWKEDGEATKVGNKYVGTVSHFSWWNCDTFSSTVTLTVTVVDAAGQPIANAGVGLVVNATNFTSYVQPTSTNGQVAGLVPANQTMTLNIYDICGNVISTTSIGPFVANTILPNVVITNAMAQDTLVQGNLVKCDNTNVTTGYVMMYYANKSMLAAVTNGTFSFSTLVCANNNNTFTLQGFDYENTQTTGDINYTFTSPVTNIGNLTACSAVTEFISYQIDNEPTVYYYSSNTGGLGPNNTGLLIMGSLASNTTTPPIYISGNTNIPGVYTTNDFFIEGGNISYSSSPTGNTIVFTLSQFGAVGDYIDLTFSGTFSEQIATGPTPITHTITGVAHVIRNN
ncbi:hypothetical protein [Flavobacterium phycosphaerae]|uniref:hypothetical protein n=1 Tax=Flavobacterium phycosphaerae TaxID=2697515 RepID=UPI00138AF5E6|nr:hypothetical protein [Flavobacterium phycosphaerae]